MALGCVAMLMALSLGGSGATLAKTANPPPISASDAALPSRPSANGPQTSQSPKPKQGASDAPDCAPWIRRDIHIADATHLPVPTAEILGFVGIAMSTRQTLPNWLGDSPNTPINQALNGWHWSRTHATHNTVTALLKTSAYGDTVMLNEKTATPWQITTLKKEGWPRPSLSQPIQWQFALGTGYRTIQAALTHLISQTESGHSVSIADAFPATIKPPTHYETYAGPIQFKSSVMACGVVPTSAAALVSGAVVDKSYWMLGQSGNGISLGFAPGWVVVVSGHAGIITTLWYREPKIAVPSVR